MNKLVTILAAAGVVVLACIGLSALPVHADLAVTEVMPASSALAAVVAPTPEPAPEPVVVDDTAANARHEHLRSYVLDVMNGWTHAVSSMPVVDYGDVASDIAFAVIMEPAAVPDCERMQSADGIKRCLWGVPPFNSDHGKAVLLAALGYWEGARYAAYVDEGECNDDAWRATEEGQHLMHRGGDCDHKQAHSLWQIHPVTDTASSTYTLCNVAAVGGSRLGAARCALELARRSLKVNGSLYAYTGEFPFEHPASDKRLDFATRALDKHPFPSL